MGSRVFFLCALLVAPTAACMNTSAPRSRQAVLDTPAPPPAAAAATPAAAPVVAVTVARPVDHPEVEMVAVPGSSLSRTRARVMVRTALDRVRSVLLDFPSYPQFMPHYKSAEVVSKDAGGRMEVIVKIDALSGMIRRWMRIEVTPPVADGARESFAARLLDGDVKAFQTRWLLEKLADGTRLTLESFLDANLTLPAAFLNSGNAAGLEASILAIKARAEDGAP